MSIIFFSIFFYDDKILIGLFRSGCYLFTSKAWWDGWMYGRTNARTNKHDAVAATLSYLFIILSSQWVFVRILLHAIHRYHWTW